MDKQIEFLQSENWLEFQEATGKEVARFSDEEFSANGITHKLSLIGEYLYIPRGPIMKIGNSEFRMGDGIRGLIEKAEKKRLGWIRIEPQTEEVLVGIKKTTDKKIVKAPHDMQPREVFVVDLSLSEEELLVAMKSKTRYNIRLAEKHGVKVFATREKKYQTAFLDLITQTAERKEITPHPRVYYEKMLQTFPEEIGRLFVAEYGGQILAVNLLIIFGATATYLHGGSSDTHRDVMAPYLLQWEQMKFAKAQGCARYDFGGIHLRDKGQGISDNGKTKTASHASYITHHSSVNSWEGITRFKTGFSPQTASTVFLGAYDIILNPQTYFLYQRLYDLKQSFHYIKKFISH